MLFVLFFMEHLYFAILNVRLPPHERTAVTKARSCEMTTYPCRWSITNKDLPPELVEHYF